MPALSPAIYCSPQNNSNTSSNKNDNDNSIGHNSEKNAFLVVLPPPPPGFSEGSSHSPDIVADSMLLHLHHHRSLPGHQHRLWAIPETGGNTRNDSAPMSLATLDTSSDNNGDEEKLRRSRIEALNVESTTSRTMATLTIDNKPKHSALHLVINSSDDDRRTRHKRFSSTSSSTSSSSSYVSLCHPPTTPSPRGQVMIDQYQNISSPDTPIRSLQQVPVAQVQNNCQQVGTSYFSLADSGVNATSQSLDSVVRQLSLSLTQVNEIGPIACEDNATQTISVETLNMGCQNSVQVVESACGNVVTTSDKICETIETKDPGIEVGVNVVPNQISQYSQYCLRGSDQSFQTGTTFSALVSTMSNTNPVEFETKETQSHRQQFAHASAGLDISLPAEPQDRASSPIQIAIKHCAMETIPLSIQEIGSDPISPVETLDMGVQVNKETDTELSEMANDSGFLDPNEKFVKDNVTYDNLSQTIQKEIREVNCQTDVSLGITDHQVISEDLPLPDRSSQMMIPENDSTVRKNDYLPFEESKQSTLLSSNERTSGQPSSPTKQFDVEISSKLLRALENTDSTAKNVC